MNAFLSDPYQPVLERVEVSPENDLSWLASVATEMKDIGEISSSTTTKTTPNTTSNEDFSIFSPLSPTFSLPGAATDSTLPVAGVNCSMPANPIDN